MSTNAPHDSACTTSPVAAPASAPRARRADHLAAGLVGAALPPLSMGLMGLSLTLRAAAGPLASLAPLAVLLVLSLGAQRLFTARSSVGNLVAGLVALVAQTMVMVAPNGAQDLPFAWARQVVPTGVVLVLAALFLAGAWSMRQARRSGREHALQMSRLAQDDEDRNRVPAAPPSRRGTQLLTLLAVAAVVWGTLRVLPGQYALLVLPDVPGAASALVVVGCFAALLGATLVSYMSSLGLRATALLLALLALPAQLSPRTPGHELLGQVFPLLPAPVALGIACVLASLGWSVRDARLTGRRLGR